MAMEDELRRRRGPAAGGYEGIGGNAALPAQMNAYLGGLHQYDYSGPMASAFGGQGLLSLLAQGPTGRHFGNQGATFAPPGLNDQNGIGGPNLAPGNIDNGLALGQPGVPQGVARGQSGAMPPGQAMHTQGWLNYAPGFKQAASLGYGTEGFGRTIGRPELGNGMGGGMSTRRDDGAGMDRGIPATGRGEAPNPGAGGGGAGLRNIPNDIGRGPGPGAGGPGGGGGRPEPRTAARNAGAGPQGYQAPPPQERGGFGGVGQNATTAIQRSNKGPAGPSGNGPTPSFGGNTPIHVVPNQGNNNTPTEARYSSPSPSVGKKKTVSNPASTRGAGRSGVGRRN